MNEEEISKKIEATYEIEKNIQELVNVEYPLESAEMIVLMTILYDLRNQSRYKIINLAKEIGYTTKIEITECNRKNIIEDKWVTSYLKDIVELGEEINKNNDSDKIQYYKNRRRALIQGLAKTLCTPENPIIITTSKKPKTKKPKLFQRKYNCATDEYK